MQVHGRHMANPVTASWGSWAPPPCILALWGELAPILGYGPQPDLTPPGPWLGLEGATAAPPIGCRLPAASQRGDWPQIGNRLD